MWNEDDDDGAELAGFTTCCPRLWQPRPHEAQTAAVSSSPKLFESTAKADALWQNESSAPSATQAVPTTAVPQALLASSAALDVGLTVAATTSNEGGSGVGRDGVALRLERMLQHACASQASSRLGQGASARCRGSALAAVRARAPQSHFALEAEEEMTDGVQMWTSSCGVGPWQVGSMQSRCVKAGELDSVDEFMLREASPKRCVAPTKLTSPVANQPSQTLDREVLAEHPLTSSLSDAEAEIVVVTLPTSIPEVRNHAGETITDSEFIREQLRISAIGARQCWVAEAEWTSSEHSCCRRPVTAIANESQSDSTMPKRFQVTVETEANSEVTIAQLLSLGEQEHHQQLQQYGPQLQQQHQREQRRERKQQQQQQQQHLLQEQHHREQASASSSGRFASCDGSKPETSLLQPSGTLPARSPLPDEGLPFALLNFKGEKARRRRVGGAGAEPESAALVAPAPPATPPLSRYGSFVAPPQAPPLYGAKLLTLGVGGAEVRASTLSEGDFWQHLAKPRGAGKPTLAPLPPMARRLSTKVKSLPSLGLAARIDH